MSLRTIKYHTSTCLPYSCEDVAITLIDGWNARTMDGSGIFFGRVSNTGKIVPKSGAKNGVAGCCPKTCPESDIVYEYFITYEDSQFIVDPNNGGLPYAPTAAEILAIGPNAYIIKKLLDFIISRT